MKQLLITLVEVLLGSTAISSYAEDDYKQRQGAKTVNVLIEGSKAVTADKPNSEVSDEGKKNLAHGFVLKNLLKLNPIVQGAGI